MKLFEKIKNAVLTGCLYYTIISLLMYALSLAILQQQMVPTLKSLCMILAASVCVAALNNIFYIKKLSPIVKLIIHFFISALIFYLIFIWMSGLSSYGTTVIIALALFIIVYALIVSAIFFIKKAFGRHENNKSEYKNQFDNVSMKK